MFQSLRLRGPWRAAATLGVVLGLLGGARAEAQQGPAAGANEVTGVVVTARRVEENVQTIPLSVTVLTAARLEQAEMHDVSDLQRITPGLWVRPTLADSTGTLIAIRGQVQTESQLTIDQSVGIYLDGAYVSRTPGLRALLDNPEELERVEVLRGPQGTLFGRNTTGGALNIVTKAPSQVLSGYLKATLEDYGFVALVGGANLPLGEHAALRVSALDSGGGGLGRDGNGRTLRDRRERYLHARLSAHPSERTSVDVSATYLDFRTGGDAYKVFGICGDPGSGCPTGSVGGVPVPGGAITLATAIEAGLVARGTPGIITFLTSPQVRQQALGLLRQSEDGGDYDIASTADTDARARSFLGSAELSQELGAGLTVRSISAFQDMRRWHYTDADATPFLLAEGSLPVRSRFLSEELQLIRRGERFNLVAGGFVSRETGSQWQVQLALPALSAANPIINDIDALNTSAAVFAQADLELAPRLTLTGGLRYTTEGRQMTARNRIGLPTTVGVPIPVLGPPLAGSILGQTAPGTVCEVAYSLLDDKSLCSARLKARFDGVSWLASVDYRAGEQTLLYAKVSRGFRSGGFNLRGSGAVEALNPFAPEFATQYEAGVKTTFWNGHARLNGSAYYTDYDNLQVQTVRTNSSGVSSSTISNAAAARIWGGELEGAAVFSPALTVTGAFAYLHREYREYHDGDLDRTPTPQAFPRYVVQLGGTYRVPTSIGELSAHADFAWQSKAPIFTDPKVPGPPPCCTQTVDPALTIYQGAFALVNARIGLRLAKGDAEIAVYVRNLTDKRYVISQVDLSALGLRTISFGDPRVVGISFRKGFGGG